MNTSNNSEDAQHLYILICVSYIKIRIYEYVRVYTYVHVFVYCLPPFKRNGSAHAYTDLYYYVGE